MGFVMSQGNRFYISSMSVSFECAEAIAELGRTSRKYGIAVRKGLEVKERAKLIVR